MPGIWERLVKKYSLIVWYTEVEWCSSLGNNGQIKKENHWNSRKQLKKNYTIVKIFINCNPVIPT